jgi:hypothetical protein
MLAEPVLNGAPWCCTLPAGEDRLMSGNVTLPFALNDIALAGRYRAPLAAVCQKELNTSTS